MLKFIYLRKGCSIAENYISEKLTAVVVIYSKLV